MSQSNRPPGSVPLAHKKLGLNRTALLPYNPLWLPKAEGLGREKAYSCGCLITPEELERCALHFEAFHLEVF